MVNQTCRLLFHNPPSLSLTCFVFFSTICSYNFHWWLTPFSVIVSKRAEWTLRHRDLNLVLCLIGLAGSLFFFLRLIDHWMALSFAAFITFLYSAPKIPQNLFRQLRDIAVGKTLFLALVWMFVTTVLPVFTENQTLKPADVMFAFSRFSMIYSICILFDYRDREDDKKEGIRSMITYLTERGIERLFFITLMVFLISTFCMAFYGFPSKLILILALPGMITALVYQRAREDFSDYLYYFALDGLMMLSSAVTLFNYF